MHRIFNLIASIVLFILGFASVSLVLFGIFYANAYVGKDIMWQGVVIQVFGVLITITFFVGSWRQFRKFRYKGRPDELLQ